MAKNLNNIVEIFDLTKTKLDEINQLLNQNKTLVLSLTKGEKVEESLKKGFSNYFNASIEVKEERKNCGTCGCGKPADILVYAWR